MTKLCPNCKTENSDNAGFCQECGTALKQPAIPKNDEKSGNRITNFWNKQSRRKKASIGILGIVFVGLIILIVIFGGMFAPLDNTPVALAPAANFTDNSIAFNYPNDMTNDSFATNGSGDGVVYEPSLVNGIVFITISNYPILNNYSTNASETKDTFVKDHNGIFEQVLSNSDVTNPNGVLISSYTRKYRDDDGSIWIEYNLFFQDNQGLIYHITVSGDVSKNSQINETATEVFNTLQNVVNQNTNSINNTINQTDTGTTSSSTNEGFISDKKAISIAKPLIKSDPSNTYSAQLENGLSVVTPYYEVSAEYNSGGNWFNESTVVDVDAKTGKIITTWQAGGFDPLIPD